MLEPKPTSFPLKVKAAFRRAGGYKTIVLVLLTSLLVLNLYEMAVLGLDTLRHGLATVILLSAMGYLWNKPYAN